MSCHDFSVFVLGVALSFALVLFGSNAEAQTVTVTFNLNMANETVSPDGPHLAGGADFGAPGDNPMSDPDGDNVWTITVDVAVGYTGYYSFTNGACPDWGCKENIAGQDCAHPENYNDRQLENITENTVINTCFGQCTTDGSCPTVGGAADVTFQVDMSEQVVSGGVFMSGTFDGWCGCTPMEDADGDGIYTATITANPGGFEWRFLNGGWGGEENFDPEVDGECTLTTGEFTNRFIMVESSTTLDPYCFGTCYACNETPCVDASQIDSTMMCTQEWDPVCGCDGVTYGNDCEAQFYGGVTFWTAGECSTSSNVTFRVDMSEQDILGPIYVTGASVDGWCGTCVEMTDADGDNVFEATVELDAGDHVYKFNNGGWDGTENLDSVEDSTCTLTTGDGVNTFVNRFFNLAAGAGDVTLDVVCFESCSECLTILEIIAESPSHGLLYELITTTDEVYDILSGSSVVTFFAPTDAAFAALDPDLLDELFVGNGTGEFVLFKHMVYGAWMSADFNDGMTLSTLVGDLTIGVNNGNIHVDNANVLAADIESSHGVVHVIDAILDPGCSDPEACNYNPDVWWITATCFYAFDCDFCIDGMVIDGDVDDDGVCDDDEVAGCTDPLAWNFDPEATELDPASCVYVPGGCESLGNSGWNSLGLGVQPIYLELMFGVEVEQELVLHVPEVLSEPASGTLLSVIDFAPSGVSGVPEGLNILWTEDMLEAGTQACLPMTGMPMETGTFTVVWTGDMVFSVFGSPLPITDFSFEQTLTVLPNPNPTAGCTYSGSSNFNPVANVDDGGCLFEGCTDPEADNYHPLFNLDDGSCIFGGLDPGDGICSSDLNGDYIVGVGDLLILLGEIGLICTP